MLQSDKVLNFMKKNNGQITGLQAQKIGVDRITLTRMNRNDQIIRLMRGVYIDPEAFGDDMAAIQYRLSKGIYFKDTALFLYGMIDRTPDTYDMNFPLPYSYNHELDVPIKIYRQKKDLYQIGRTQIKSPSGNILNTYNIERTLCDILRSRSRSDAETIKQAMNNYVNSDKINIGKLMDYAEIFKVKKELMKYMGVLL